MMGGHITRTDEQYLMDMGLAKLDEEEWKQDQKWMKEDKERARAAKAKYRGDVGKRETRPGEGVAGEATN